MKPLDLKLFRDLWHIRGQVAAIAVVIGCGVATVVMSLGNLTSLRETREAYYERYRFAHVFAHATRAPRSVAQAVAEIPGVAQVDDRIVQEIILNMEGLEEPARGRVISIPEGEQSRLNNVVLRTGRFVRKGHPDEVLVNEPFAEAHRLEVGDTFSGNVNGHRRTLRVVGTVLSPEYVYAIGPGQFVPDNRRFGLIWMGREALEAAYDLKGAFNDLSMTITRSASEQQVIEAVDLLLDPYGGIGAYSRQDHVSDSFLRNEIDQLETMTNVIPPIFLAVAAFLLNIVINRLVQTEREQIGLLKAFGYTDMEVGLHYYKFVLSIGVLGVLFGWTLGSWMGKEVTELYADFFQFPFLYYKLDSQVYAISALISLAAALVGSLSAVRRAVRLAPAVAMVPPPPTTYNENLLEKFGVWRGLSQPTRMIVRHITRWPLRAGLTMLGIAMSVGVLISSLFFFDAIDEMLDVFFFQTERQDVAVTLVQEREDRVVTDIAHLPGVMLAEPYRSVPSRLRLGHLHERAGILGIPHGAELRRLVDINLRPVELPPAGLVLTDKLAELLDANEGDMVTVEVLEGRRPTLEVPVTLIVQEYIGKGAYMDRRALNRLMLEGPSASGINVLIDSNQKSAFFRKLKEMPAVEGVSVQTAALSEFEKILDETIETMVFFYVIFAAMIAVGVVYNSARISLSERGRELASLRVLGFTEREVSMILLGELMVLTFVALPVGCLIGYGLAAYMCNAFDTELFRVPFIIRPATYGYSVLVVLVAAIISGWIVARRVANLDLIAVLKTRE